MQRCIYFFFTLLFVSNLSGQSLWLHDGLSPVETIDVETLPDQDNVKLRDKVKRQSKNAGPLTFAEPINTNFKIDQRGTWESVEGDREVWRLRVKSPGAYSLNLGFEDFYLPPSAVLFLSDTDKTYVIGPLTADDNEDHRQWWSPIIPGDDITIEIQVDADERADLVANLTKVNHDFAGFGAALSGSCNVDVVCDADDGFALIDRYRDLINSVGMYSINGFNACTGSLINTTENDCTPYFLTAFHCELRQENAATVVVYWNFENSTCRPPGSAASGANGDGPMTNFNSGSRVVAEFQTSDFTLIELDDDVNPAFQPFYSGWNVEETVFDTAFCIHHPNTEEKRISFDFDRTVPFSNDFFMRVNDWDFGTTEPGSSGSPLYTTDGEIIGQLTGGLAACGNDEFDEYGMLLVSWTGGGTPQSRLSDWLDPGNTGRRIMTGRSCVSLASLSPMSISACSANSSTVQTILTVSSGYENGADVSLAELPSGVSGSLSSNRLSPNSSVTVTLDISQLTTDFDGQIEILLQDEFGTETATLAASLDTEIPNRPEALSPLNNQEDVSFDAIFSWTETGDNYNIELSTSADFDQVFFSASDLSETELNIPSLDPTTTFFWRVESINSCGTSGFSPVFSFTTANISCSSITSSDGPFTISTVPNVVSSTIMISEDFEIADLNVLDIIGTHTFISDLGFRLIGPDGRRVNLLIQACGNEDNFNVSFDDESENVNVSCPFNDGTVYRPVSPLSVFDGMSSQGRWTLEITDAFNIDGGRFDSWSLELCLIDGTIAEEEENPNSGDQNCDQVVSSNDPLTISDQVEPAISSIEITEDFIIDDINILNVNGSHTFVGDLDMTLIGPNGTRVLLLTGQCGSNENFDLSFDDQSTLSNVSCPITDGIRYRPEQSLSVFSGLSSQGVWSIEVSDRVQFDDGVFNSWALELCQADEGSLNRSLAVSPSELFLCEQFFEPITFTIDLAGDYDNAISIELQDAEGNLIGQPVDANSGGDLEITLNDGSRFFDSADGTLALIITDTQGSTSMDIPVSVQVDDLAIQQLSPGSGEVDVELEPTFQWSTTESTIDFRLRLLDDTGAEVLNMLLGEVVDTFMLTSRLNPLTTYQWSVAAIGECSPDFVTELASFTTRNSTATFDISESDINVFPNPVSDQLTIAKETAWEAEASFRLFNAQGVLMHVAQLDQEVSLVDLENLPVGAYFYQITEGEDSFIQRLIIVR